MSKQVIIIGAGLSGIVAAYAAHSEGAEVVLIDRGGIGLGSNSAMSNAVFASPGPQYSPEQYVADTIEIGGHINSRAMVERIAQEAEQVVRFLKPLGLELEPAFSQYKFKTERQDIIRGANMMQTMAKGLQGLAGVARLTGFQVSQIIRSSGQCRGVQGWNRRGQRQTLTAPAVILAAGGAGAVYERNDNQKTTLGQGYHLAARAGLDLWDMEFVQFYPLVLAQDGLPRVMLYPPYPPQARILNRQGQDLIAKHGISDVNQAIMKMRDRFSGLLYQEGLKGPVRMDFSQVPEPMWHKYPMAMLSHMKYDFRSNPVTISPGAHFFMGGVRIDHDGRTSLPGLFACGEMVWGLHGANRRGGNALIECLVSGCLAGRAAARGLADHRQDQQPASEPEQTLPLKSNRPLMAAYRERLQAIRKIAWDKAGVVRSQEGMRQGLEQLERIRHDLDALQPASLEELRRWEDLRAAAFVLRAILTASLGRQESRGAFLRQDYPEPGGDPWRCNSCLAFDQESGRFSLTHHPAE